MLALALIIGIFLTQKTKTNVQNQILISDVQFVQLGPAICQIEGQITNLGSRFLEENFVIEIFDKQRKVGSKMFRMELEGKKSHGFWKEVSIQMANAQIDSVSVYLHQ